MADFKLYKTGEMTAQTMKTLAGMATPMRHSRLFESNRIPYRGRVEKFHGKMAPCGRNEPCPCGSGKKYKKCCLPKG